MNVEISSRQHLIMNYIREHGSVQVDHLSEHLQVTPQTIRRDLNQLYDLKLVQRVHGGAIVKDNVENLGYGARKILMAEEKIDIARRAAELVPDNSSLFINIGTTTERVAEYLSNRSGLLVITNNINVAAMLWPARGLEVMIASGSIRRSDGGIVGAGAEEFVSKFKLDYAVIGCSAIDEDGDFFDFDLREVRVTQAIMQNARAIILVTDSMKFERRAPIRIGNLSEVDTLVTDEGLPADAARYCRDNDVELVIVAHDDGRKSTAGKS
ncbi:MAG TPA: DeoR/GlpR family DNA-binding transcription regulator [Gammaproteobacteria bacterium]|nr:DeoR/GlpR family DNA-binding transcription regulator [Gammaproteobacteria bacterium]